MTHTAIEAAYYKPLQHQEVKCLLCPNGCHLRDTEAGICFVRQNHSGKLYAGGYGKITSEALDAIEKKPLYHFHPGKKIYSVGSFGCNLACKFCQNHAISKAVPPMEERTPEELVGKAVELLQAGNIGIAFTYNEPLINIEYVMDTFKLAKKNNLKTILVTNGYLMKDPLLDLLPLTDAMNIDLKAYDEEAFKSFCSGKLSYVRDTIETCCRKCHVEVTTLMVPGLNANLEGIEGVARWLASLNPNIPFHLSRFFPRYRMADVSPTDRGLLDDAFVVAKKHLNHVYLGNV